MNSIPLPNSFFSGHFTEGHVQGIAIDLDKKHVYYSFTTLLVKTDFDGNIIGTVNRIAGHLGCITFDADRRKVYGSLELKHDSIGAGIIKRTGWDPSTEDAFYLVEFDCDAIVRKDMSAETDKVMRAVWLREAIEDYNAIDEVSGKKHRYGCSGIDGTAYGAEFGKDKKDRKKITVCYGIYSDVEREDNDHQVILQYDPSVFDNYGKELLQSEPHHSGPDKCEKRYFLYTGNTRWGVQNFEYDPYTDSYFAAVYKGTKEWYPNFPLFVIDQKAEPTLCVLKGRKDEQGLLLTLKKVGKQKDIATPGVDFAHGSTGFFACGDGTYYISHSHRRAEDNAQSSTVYRYTLTDNDDMFKIM